jgi:uncharacterized phage protein (TIGR02220 family)
VTAVRIEGMAWTDPRVIALAEMARYNVDEAIGRLARLWAWCTEKESYTAPAWLVAQILRVSADDFVRIELGEWVAGVHETIRIKGTHGRIEWLANKRRAARAGGEANRQRLEAKREPDDSQAIARREPGDSQTGATGDPGDSQTVSMTEPNRIPLALSLSPDLLNTEDQKPPIPQKPRAGRPRKPKPNEPTARELASVRVVLDKLGTRNGVTYLGSKEHTKLVVDRLRDGYSEMDLRVISLYCAESLGWGDDDKMRAYLRPETLYGPKTIARYIDAARSWYAANYEPLPESEAK